MYAPPKILPFHMHFDVVLLGGGFGGKEIRSTFLSSPVAVAAHKLVYYTMLSIMRC